jgi:DNA polymerase III sliding clamp (beta) subunit (PCNA family)
MLSKSNLEIAKIVSKGEGVLITQDRTVANDGRRLIEITRPKCYKEAEFLKIDGFQASYIDMGGETRTCHPDFIMTKEDALDINKKLKKSAKLPILENAVVSHNGATHIATAEPSSFSTSVQKINPLEGKYPKYQEVIPDSADTTLKIGLNPKLLSEICNIADKFQDDSYKALIFEFSGPDRAVKMTTKNPETDQEFTAVLMPMNIDDKQ